MSDISKTSVLIPVIIILNKQLMTVKYLHGKVIKKAIKTSMTLKYTTILIQGLFHSRETYISVQQFLEKLKK